MKFKNCQPKIQESLNLIAEWMQRFVDHIFAYYDLLLPIGSDKTIKRLQMWLNRRRAKFSNFAGEITIKASPPTYVFCLNEYE